MTDRKGFLLMDIIFKGRHTDVLDRFRKHATSKLAKMERLDQKVIRVDVEVTAEHNPRQSGRAERVELTITTRGPAIRAEAAAEDRFAALDLALAKLESRLRRSCDRRKDRHGAARLADADFEVARVEGSVPMSRTAPDADQIPAAAGADAAVADAAGADAAGADAAGADAAGAGISGEDKIIAIAMEGDGPLVVREKMHVACPMTIDQALFEMELIGHDFFLFTDTTDGLPSVVYRRRGYQYGVIRLVEDAAAPLPVHGPGLANGHRQQAANLASG
jgi:ribosomal subunit interface protein